MGCTHCWQSEVSALGQALTHGIRVPHPPSEDTAEETWMLVVRTPPRVRDYAGAASPELDGCLGSRLLGRWRDMKRKKEGRGAWEGKWI